MNPVFNLSLDDQSPHVKAGLNFEAVEWCLKLIERWPDLKVTLFIPAAFRRLGEEPHFLTQYPAWVARMNSLPTHNFEFGTHSYYHSRLSVRYGNSANNEVEHTTYAETKLLVEHMIGEFDTAGLRHVGLYRAPGWHLGQPAAQALTDLGFTICGNQHYYGVLNGKVAGMKYVTSNWDCLSDCALAGDVLACSHTSNWTTNYFDQAVYNKVVRLLESREFEFRFLSEV